MQRTFTCIFLGYFRGRCNRGGSDVIPGELIDEGTNVVYDVAGFSSQFSLDSIGVRIKCNMLLPYVIGFYHICHIIIFSPFLLVYILINYSLLNTNTAAVTSGILSP